MDWDRARVLERNGGWGDVGYRYGIQRQGKRGMVDIKIGDDGEMKV